MCKVSVIVPTYNRQKLLTQTLESLTHQSMDSRDFEVIVVDDGGSDGSDEICAEFSDRLGISYLWQEDRGFRVAAARNLGLKAAKGKIAVFLDSGVAGHSELLQAHFQVHLDGPRPSAVVGYVYCFDNTNEEAAEIENEIIPFDADGNIMRMRSNIKRLDLREPMYVFADDKIDQLKAPWNLYWTCNASVSLEMAHSVGLFDENFRSWGGEDVEFAYRLVEAGADIKLARSAEAIHYPHPKDYGPNSKSASKNYRYFSAKHGVPLSSLFMGRKTWQKAQLQYDSRERR